MLPFQGPCTCSKMAKCTGITFVLACVATREIAGGHVLAHNRCCHFASCLGIKSNSVAQQSNLSFCLSAARWLLQYNGRRQVHLGPHQGRVSMGMPMRSKSALQAASFSEDPYCAQTLFNCLSLTCQAAIHKWIASSLLKGAVSNQLLSYAIHYYYAQLRWRGAHCLIRRCCQLAEACAAGPR